MKFLLLLILLLQGCVTYKPISYKDYNLNAWYVEPDLKLVRADKFRPLGDDNYRQVVKPYIEEALADLNKQQIIRIDREKANLFCQNCFKPTDDSKFYYYLIRALNTSGTERGYHLSVYENSMWIDHATMGHIYQIGKTAFVVRADREIKQLYITISDGVL